LNSIRLDGYIKDPCHEALSQAGRRRVRGIAQRSIFVTILLMAANTGKIDTFKTLRPRSKNP
jgi:hypothetical protein